MAKYAALIEIDSGWLGKEQYLIKGASVKKIVQKFESVQDIPCLIEMGRSQEDPAGQQSLDQLEVFYGKYQNSKLTVEDLAALNVSVSIGSIVCHGIAVGDEEISTLKAQYPAAIRK